MTAPDGKKGELNIDRGQPKGDFCPNAIHSPAKTKERPYGDTMICYTHKVDPAEVPTYWLKDHCPDCLRAELAAHQSHDRCGAGMRSRIKSLEEELERAKEREIAHTKAVGESAAVLIRERDESRAELAESRKECLEQARLNGMGGERELRLMANLAALTEENGRMREALKVADHALEVAGFQDVQPIRACVRSAAAWITIATPAPSPEARPCGREGCVDGNLLEYNPMTSQGKEYPCPKCAPKGQEGK